MPLKKNLRNRRHKRTARKLSALGVETAKDRAVIVRTCPVTCGLPTKMSKESFTASCKRQLNERAYRRKAGMNVSPKYCDICKGHIAPKEIEFVEIKKEVRVMPSIARIGICDVCSDKTTVTNAEDGSAHCNTCRKIKTYIKQKPNAVAEVIKAVGKVPDVIAALGSSLPETMQVELSKGPIDAIAKLGGGEGEDTEGLIESVASVIVENKQLWDDRCQQSLDRHSSDQLARRESALWELINAMDDTVADREEMYRLYNQLFDAYREKVDSKGADTELTGTQLAISQQCDQLKATLLDKNRKYGNSALSPVRLFSKADPIEQIRVRIDDKIKRIKNINESDGDDEDSVMDLAGYLILLRIAEGVGGNDRL